MLGRDEMTLQVPLTGKVNLAKLTPETRQNCKGCALILAQVTSLIRVLQSIYLDPDPDLLGQNFDRSYT